MAIATEKPGVTGQAVVRASIEGGWTPRVDPIVTGRGAPAVERRLYQAVLVQPPGDAQAMAVPLITLPPPSGAWMSPATQGCACPEWHILRLFGRGCGRVSFESHEEQLADAASSGVCQVCGYGLRVERGRQ